MDSNNLSYLSLRAYYHRAQVLDKVIDSLRSVSYEAEDYQLPTAGNASKIVNDDDRYMRSVLATQFKNGRDAVLIVHSFAGFAGTAAISGLDKTTRAGCGELYSLGGIIYLVAFLPLNGNTLAQLLNEKHPAAVINVHLYAASAWSLRLTYSIKESEGLTEMTDGANIFYNDCNEGTSKAAVGVLYRRSPKAFISTPSKIGWREDGYNGRSAYIRYLKDNIVPFSFQNELLQQTGAEWTIKAMDTSHSPFL